MADNSRNLVQVSLKVSPNTLPRIVAALRPMNITSLEISFLNQTQNQPNVLNTPRSYHDEHARSYHDEHVRSYHDEHEDEDEDHDLGSTTSSPAAPQHNTRTAVASELSGLRHEIYGLREDVIKLREERAAKAAKELAKGIVSSWRSAAIKAQKDNVTGPVADLGHGFKNQPVEVQEAMTSQLVAQLYSMHPNIDVARLAPLAQSALCDVVGYSFKNERKRQRVAEAREAAKMNNPFDEQSGE
eukprot:comp7283_c0_seq1/m.2990 comp7283_c0_seq1/g.2990  ORF comp7283_c0_seq1/g.2990 comp7283_c0_seq1/m.2990 type:complete len:243 (-) comp7283_c0_seq1:472-1200(-)